MTKKNNQQILGTYVHIHTKYEVYVTFYSQLSMTANQRKVPYGCYL